MIDLQGAHDLKVSLVDVMLDTDVEIGSLKWAHLYKCERLQAFFRPHASMFNAALGFF